ncbi:hypothetical protein EOM86_00895 [Candidatus Nomurabacteria bacterium]|nr:hypothetical protein [Candidatus Nomurabacteria bacterium]
MKSSTDIFLRKCFIALILFMLISSLSLQSAIPISAGSEDPVPAETGLTEGMDLSVSNGSLELFIDSSTAQFAVRCLESGDVWLSNPDGFESDPVAVQDTKNLLASQISLSYYQDNQEKSMNSYKDCVALGQFEIKKIQDGFRVEMRIGKEFQRYLLPQILTKESFENKLYANVEDGAGRKKIDFYYNYYSLDDAKTQSAKDTMLETFPMVAEHDIYVLRANMSEREKKQLEEIIVPTGFTFEMIDEQYELLGYVDKSNSFPLFNIPVEYVLEGDYLVARIPADEISYDQNADFDLYKIRLLQFFGAGHGQEEGYIFLPDGSGTLLRFNNEPKMNVYGIVDSVYGPDRSSETSVKKSVQQNFILPVFGIKRNNSAMIAIIEDGDAMSQIIAERRGNSHSYDTVYSEFLYKNKVEISVDSQIASITSWIELDRISYSDEYKIRYSFLSGDNTEYSDMAIAYRDYLEENNIIKKLGSADAVPFYLELLGAIERMDTFLGMPVKRSFALTKFNDALEISKHLISNGVEDLNIRYKGWFNGGLIGTSPNRVSIERVLGGRKGFEELVKYANLNGIGFFPDADFMKIPKDSLFDGFSPRNDAARTLDRKLAFYDRLDLTSNDADKANSEYLISPGRIVNFYDSFYSRIKRFGASGLSFGTTGQQLHSDFRKGSQLNRQQAKQAVQEMLGKAGTNTSLMVDGGNAYTFEYASHILNLPSDDSSYIIENQSVPFVQIALHGYIRYAGHPMNLSVDNQDELLKIIEYGSGIYFTFLVENGFRLKDTVYSNYFSVNAADWLDHAIRTYSEVNDLMGDLSDKPITGHMNPSYNVYVTLYEGGGAVAVNYNNEDITVSGVTVKAKGYARIDEAWGSWGE